MAQAAATHRRPRLLPAALLLGTAGYLSKPAFLPAPSGSRIPAQQQQQAAASAAALSALTAAALPAHAVVVDPLAHGAPGTYDAGVLQGISEKATFFGLLVSTILSWWRVTLGGGQAESQQVAGRAPSFWALCFANLSLVVLLSNRWIESGHFPLSNMYESLSFLAWGVTAVTLYFMASQSEETEESKLLVANGRVEGRQAQQATVDIAASCASPVALGIVAFATLSLPKALQKSSALVPALQSNWLVMHVSVVMCSYATLMFGSVLCMAVLALGQPKDSPITAFREAILPAFQNIASSLSPQPVVAASAQGAPAVAMTGTTGMDAGNSASSPASPASKVTAAATGASSAVTIEFSSSSGAAAVLSKDEQLALTLDDLAYRSLLLGFGFLTIGIVSGAVWANEAWGNYWSWDPKETWALITWLVYAGYLHTRLQLGWDTRDSAKLGAFGFLVVWVCYIGVNLMGIGLHSYGFFLK
eukprot:TRINITY_DN6529_c0_g1_i1.p1 TRINITY_DN6529_c0_g1~~TRINITY_DN6529_c0_g1_i1.p1  ORF type:complete len:475 (-),score=89.28 TRINITY_DN6529_c0_g1_i1:63-1487(-)